MTSLFIAHPDISYEEFRKLLADIAIRGIRATFKRPLIIGDESGPVNFDLGDPKMIGFIGEGDVSVTNLWISWNASEDTVILARWKDEDSLNR